MTDLIKIKYIFISLQMVERSMAQMSMLFGHVIRGLSAGARVFEFIESKPTIPMHGGKTMPFHALMGNISFKGWFLFHHRTFDDKAAPN